MEKRNSPIHHSIKQNLGYDENTSDKEFLEDWKKRSSQVCKPCWELKYCPYGLFVEHSPPLPLLRKEIKDHIDFIKKCLETGYIHRCESLDDETREFYTKILIDAEKDLTIIADFIEPQWRFSKLVEMASESDDPIREVLKYEDQPIEQYRVPIPLDFDQKVQLSDQKTLDSELVKLAQNEASRMKKALETGIDEHIKELNDSLRRYFETEILNFKEKDYPEDIPEEVEIMKCNVFGHICPVIFVGEAVTETSELRRKGRYLPFKTKMRVVRRDNYTCQNCGQHLKDDEVEFDHIIPVARGGSSEEHNIRLTCFTCNRDKSDNVEI